MHYRRSNTAGASFFFTVVTYQRKSILCLDENIGLLRQAMTLVKSRHPFRMDAFVFLPDHIHCIWTLPAGDSDFSTRWMLIKSHFTRQCAQARTQIASRSLKREQCIWQRRFWEHQIRDEQDYIRHIEYIHYNPVKHGLVPAPKDWQYSSFHRYAEAGVYNKNWGVNHEIIFDANVGHE